MLYVYFQILEYAEDLEYYWIDGYGHTLTTKIACVMLKDAITKLKYVNFFSYFNVKKCNSPFPPTFLFLSVYYI